MVRTLAAVLIGIATSAIVLLAPPAMAAEDIKPVATEPTNRQVLARPPAAITMAFSWNIDPDQARIFVINSKGKNITAAVPKVDGNNVWVNLDYSMSNGTYTVEYRVNGPKGAPVGGTYQFAVGSAGNWTTIKDPYWSGPAEQPEIFKGGDPNNPYDKNAKPETKPSEGEGLEIVREDGSVEYPKALDTPKPIADSSNSDTGWIIGGSAAAVAVIAGAGYWWWKRRTRTPSTRGGRRAAR